VSVKLLTLDETCARLGGISRTTLYELRVSGELPSVRIGERRFVTEQALDAFVARLEGRDDQPDQ
jgi:excisionase family DNA binding protein